MISNNDIQSLAALFIEYTNRSLFITGKAGTGKTTFLKAVKEQSSKNKIVLAPTGIAAINAEGTTINAFFQIPPGFYLPRESQVNRTEFHSMSNIIRNLNYSPSKKALIKNLDLIFIDEISMVRADQVDLLDQILRHVRNNSLPFGNVQMVFMGDLFQLPPILKNEDVFIYSQFYTSPFFFNATTIRGYPLVQIEFQQVYRQLDNDFVHILNQIRNNRITDEALSVLNTRYIVEESKEQVEEYITITSHNATAQAINNERLNTLPGTEYTFEGTITGDFKDSMLPMEQILKLKMGAQVMFIKNDLGEKRRYFNGKVGKVTHISQDEIKVVFADNLELAIEKVSWYAYDYNTSTDNKKIMPVPIGAFIHYPIKLAWAVTIHKSQGLTFEHAIIDAANSFEAGQVYVALSRVSTLKGLLLRTKITRESIQSKTEVLAFHAPLSKEKLERELTEGQTDFFLAILLEKFSLKSAIYVLQDLFARPETFRQKIDLESLNSFATILTELETLDRIIMRFEHEIRDALKENLGYNYVLDRFASAKTYIASKISENCVVPFYQTIQRVLGKKGDQHTKAYWERLNGLIKERDEEMSFAVEAVRQFAQGTPLIQLINDLRRREVVSNTTPVIKSQIKKKTSISKSIKETIEWIESGRTISEIASIRNLGTSTIEAHVLEAVNEGLISIEKILEESRLNAIREAVKAFGDDLYKIKEHFGDSFSFFEIRLGISQVRA